jgi:hypothetical protein
VSERSTVKRLSVQVVDQPEHLLPLTLQMRLVEPLVPRVQLDLDHLLLLRRQLGRHDVLGPAQHDRPDPPPQLGQPGRVALPLDRPPVVLREPVSGREQAGGGDGQQRPQVHQAVLQRGAGDRQFERSRDPAGTGMGLGPVVLDELGLVEHQTRPGQPGQGLALDAEQGVGGDHQVGTGNHLGHRLSALAGRLGQGDRAEPRREPVRLGCPVGHHTGRRDDKEGWRFGLDLPGLDDQRQGLQRLAQAHVVGQDPPRRWLQRKWSQRRPVELVGRSCAAVRPSLDRLDRRWCRPGRVRPRSTAPTGRSRRPGRQVLPQLVWKRLIDSSGCGRSTSAWDSVISSRSAVNSGRSRSKYTPVSRTRYSSPRARATNSSSNGTSSPSIVTVTCRSNQSVARACGWR